MSTLSFKRTQIGHDPYKNHYFVTTYERNKQTNKKLEKI